MTKAQLLEFQTLISTIVGFTGVCITLIVNAAVAERRRRKEVRHDASVLRIAIIGELVSVMDVLNTTEKKLKDHVSDLNPLDIDNLTLVYRSQLSKIGLLSVQEAQVIIPHYVLMVGTLRDINRRIELLADSPDLGRSSEESQDLLLEALAKIAVQKDMCERIVSILHPRPGAWTSFPVTGRE